MFKDARNAQILFLSLFLGLGVNTRDWTLKPELIIAVIGTCLLTQGLMIGLQQLNSQSLQVGDFNKASLSSWKSAVITALGLCLLLRANSETTMILAGVCAIASKFILHYRGKHFFNPANFGIITALTLTSDAWVSPGQWGTESWYFLLFLGLGGMILKQVGRWETSATFLATYAGLEAIRHLYLGWSFDVYTHQLMSGSLLLFALFMLTDPRSIPNASKSRIIWAISIAVLTFILQHLFFLSTAIFWALFLLSPLTLVFDEIWSNPRFIWLNYRSTQFSL
ncbi:RnfABCDGE type electron transport complex subunit D [Limnoraphis robusta Tam1]|uniref:RnfABCDGE type electron transport complex subunit D n=1 Tax=Limnoraphis robusta TaxID=1118279 RepID=UPI002B215F40|nr:RnfABCDGE type electron transport complex subunit D [Limnoraphis robusta]MEA5542445.1 RnfABCDGE type electron transport complex subunit D [Limnoraphis robusta Tam1]